MQSKLVCETDHTWLAEEKYGIKLTSNQNTVVSCVKCLCCSVLLYPPSPPKPHLPYCLLDDFSCLFSYPSSTTRGTPKEVSWILLPPHLYWQYPLLATFTEQSTLRAGAHWPPPWQTSLCSWKLIFQPKFVPALSSPLFPHKWSGTLRLLCSWRGGPASVYISALLPWEGRSTLLLAGPCTHLIPTLEHRPSLSNKCFICMARGSFSVFSLTGSQLSLRDCQPLGCLTLLYWPRALPSSVWKACLPNVWPHWRPARTGLSV